MAANENSRMNGVDAMGSSVWGAGFAMLQGSNLGRSIGLEATQFWAKRLSAVAEQIEALARCEEPGAIFEAQIRYFELAQDDYAKESQVLKNIVAKAAETNSKSNAHHTTA